MSTLHSTRRLFVPTLMTAAIVAACGGGGGGGTESSLLPGNAAPKPVAFSAGARVTMSCADVGTYECSGGEILLAEPYGVAVTNSGVFAYGRSTNNPTATTASGFELVTGATTEIRIGKSAAGDVNRAIMVLRNLGLSWDGTKERPPIIEAFDSTSGVTRLDSSGAVVIDPSLPGPNDFTYYDFATAGRDATQGNYANNRYFPRDQATNPSRCSTPPCPTLEVEQAIQFDRADWRSSGTDPDRAHIRRGHSDGDIHAGNELDQTPFDTASGPGVPYPGNKGFRDLINFSYTKSNLSVWFSRDTVDVAEWAPPGAQEHVTNRQGIVAFGDTTALASVPRSGTDSTYEGIVYGYYTPDGSAAPVTYRGKARLLVDFAARQAVINVSDVFQDGTNIAVPVTMSDARIGVGDADTNAANYLAGRLSVSGMEGGVSGRFFASEAREIAGTFTLTNSGTHAFAVGGFIVRSRRP